MHFLLKGPFGDFEQNNLEPTTTEFLSLLVTFKI